MTTLHQLWRAIVELKHPQWSLRKGFGELPVNRTMVLLAACVFLVSAVGCSKDLTREEAASKILKSQSAALFGSDITGSLILRQANGLYFFPEEEYLGNRNEVMKLEAEGYITIGDKIFLGSMGSFANKAKPFLKTVGSNYDLLIGIPASVEVTGIGRDSDATRKVECTIKYKPTPFTPLLKNPDNMTQQKTFNFKKFDDGWRIDAQRKN